MGSGGLGGYFGALFAEGGADVVFIARGAHLEAMRHDRLRLEGGPHPAYLKHVRATDDPGEVGPVDPVMVCVKLWDTEAALEQLRPLVGPETTLVSFQNGVLKDSYLRAVYDESHSIGGVAYVAATVSAPGVISRTGPLQRLIYGEFDGRQSARPGVARHPSRVASSRSRSRSEARSTPPARALPGAACGLPTEIRDQRRGSQ
jgi:2-dehydropantoate 2-reductase